LVFKDVGPSVAAQTEGKSNSTYKSEDLGQDRVIGFYKENDRPLNIYEVYKSDKQFREGEQRRTVVDA